jgi:diguanylate cyclase (GGDEF)-like protein
MVDALRIDRFALMRDAVLWQRSMRTWTLAALAILALLLGSGDPSRVIPKLAAVVTGYALVVALAVRVVRFRPPAQHARIPTLLVTADITAIAMIVWLNGAPSDAGRMFLPALLVVQISAYYFGQSLGGYAVALSALWYLLIARVLPAQVIGAGMSIAGATYSVVLFAVVGGILVAAYAGFRARMHQLRLFCRLIEEGDLTPAIAVGVDSRPDDLTLLARSFDAMRLRLAEQIGTDPLTACLNRRALETRLRTEWRQAKRRNTTVAVLAVDIDHFKRINDTRGHPFGDAVLQELAGIFKATARDTDAVARLGGDEFVIVLPDTGWQGALTFAERMRRKVEDRSFGGGASPMSVTISVGVALARGSDPMSPETLLQEADRSLYKAKSGGRNRIFA